MSKFKAGDRVVCTNALGVSKRLTEGKEYVILKPGTINVYIEDDTGKGHFNTDRFILTKPQVKPQEKQMKPTNSYTFKAPWGMVDFELLSKDLSYSKPMAIIQDSGGEGKVVVHRSIFEKALICKMNTPHWRDFEFNRTTKGNIGRIKDWVKEVKQATYPDSDKPEVITVQQLEVN